MRSVNCRNTIAGHYSLEVVINNEQQDKVVSCEVEVQVLMRTVVQKVRWKSLM